MLADELSTHPEPVLGQSHSSLLDDLQNALHRQVSSGVLQPGAEETDHL